mmetsp:Transcript_90225/g.160705  ORF Transcript_90225/g.160705 Transcript_90225/m.160705 type:complete len:81 (-) Transcript_90225:109-351(-)
MQKSSESEAVTDAAVDGDGNEASELFKVGSGLAGASRFRGVGHGLRGLLGGRTRETGQTAASELSPFRSMKERTTSSSSF